MPLYRQEKDWANQGISLSRATIANWIIRASNDWLSPLWETMKTHLLKQDVIHADESVIQVLKEEEKKPSSESRMWVYCSGNTGVSPIQSFRHIVTLGNNEQDDVTPVYYTGVFCCMHPNIERLRWRYFLCKRTGRTQKRRLS
ncbi:MAG TPA: transposase [Desulfitobacterium dehalogenans]|uniref:Transposase n=1 Tax=Desulfitobacterium dehalogenans TaxID=36854 RepID=A0A7C7D8J5_9FIRM|nr:transposase [Desulfitobacterium dehalogenans]